MEEAFFFRNGAYRLFGVRHAPAACNPFGPPKAGVVFCEPFAEEKLTSHRTMVNLARHLAAGGIPVLRFDSMGHGDSDGDFENSTVESRLSDIRCAVDFFIEQNAIEKIILLGVRLGATLAALATTCSSSIDSVVLISPIINGRTYMEQCLRSNLATQMAIYKKIVKNTQQLIEELEQGELVNIDGYLLSKTLYKQICAIDLMVSPVAKGDRILILQVSDREGKPFEKGVRDLYECYNRQCSEVHLESVTESQFWKDSKVYLPTKRNINSSVLEWIMKAYVA